MRIPYLLVQNALDAMVGDKNVVSMSGQAMVRPVYRRTPQGLGKADAGREQCGLWLRVSHHAVVSLRALYARGLEELTLGGGNVVFGFRRIISQVSEGQHNVQEM
eukprot:1146135-Pelagomonas_calceolata.AAC.25